MTFYLISEQPSSKLSPTALLMIVSLSYGDNYKFWGSKKVFKFYKNVDRNGSLQVINANDPASFCTIA